MVTRSKSYVHSWHFVIIVRPVRQEIVHHARTYGGRVKGNESPSSLRAFGSLAFRAMLSVYTPSVFSLVPPSLQHFSPVPSLSLSISLSFTKTFTIWTVYADVIGGGCRRKRKKGRSIRRIISEEETRGLGISSYILIHVFFALQTGMNLFRFPIIREKSEIERIVHRLQKGKREKTFLNVSILLIKLFFSSLDLTNISSQPFIRRKCFASTRLPLPIIALFV